MSISYCDASHTGSLTVIDANKVHSVIVTLNDPEITETLVSRLSAQRPELRIYVRGHSLEQCHQLRQTGVHGVVSEDVEASLELALLVLTHLGVNDKTRKAVLDNFRHTAYAQIDDV